MQLIQIQQPKQNIIQLLMQHRLNNHKMLSWFHLCRPQQNKQQLNQVRLNKGPIRMKEFQEEHLHRGEE